MRILIVTPHAGTIATGNRCSAEQWRRLLEGVGHEVELAPSYDGQSAEVLVALNAERSHSSIAAFRGKKIVVLTGTDIYPEPGSSARDSMRRADCLVALQSKAVEQVPAEFRSKVRVIVQAAEPPAEKAESDAKHFDIAVVAHLRAVKDPLRAAAAVRLLPESSKVRVRHVGAVLEPEFESLAQREMAENSRYQWLGEVEPAQAARLIANSDLLAITSHSEGAGRVVGEAVVAGTPVLSTRIDGVVGLLGEDYPGFFPVGNAAALAELIARAEGETGFL